MKTKITKKLCSNCIYVDMVEDIDCEADHMCELTQLTINNIHEHYCSNHILDTDIFVLSNERETVRKHEQKQEFCKYELYNSIGCKFYDKRKCEDCEHYAK